jgi:hypothetical protein
MIDAFGPEKRARIERFFQDWEQAKTELFAAVPPLLEINDANRRSARDGIMKFLQDVRGQNAEFLELAVNTYSREVVSSLAKEREASR